MNQDRAIILGCGPSTGVPEIGGPDGQGDWGECNPRTPENRRMRSSLYIESRGVRLLIDTGPDLRTQLLNNRLSRLDAVLYTHTHADHIVGIDDLRSICRAIKGALPVYGPPEVLSFLQSNFAYCFRELTDPDKIFLPHLIAHPVEEVFHISAIPVVPVKVAHGGVTTYAYEIGDLVYMPDVWTFEEEAGQRLKDKVWIVDAYQRKPHFSHAHLDKVLDWAEKYRPERVILTNLGKTMDYETLKKELPAHIQPAFDGMRVEI